jgi:anti-anti-sigma factor
LTFTVPQMHGDALMEELRQELLTAVIRAQASRVVLDFRNVEYLSSAGFRPLLSLRRHLHEKGGSMVLCGLAPEVAEVFHVTRMISTSRSSPAPFDVEDDVPAAMARLNAGPGP